MRYNFNVATEDSLFRFYRSQRSAAGSSFIFRLRRDVPDATNQRTDSAPFLFRDIGSYVFRVPGVGAIRPLGKPPHKEQRPPTLNTHRRFPR